MQIELPKPTAWANINKHGDITHTANRRSSWARTALYTQEQLIQSVQANLAAQQNRKGEHETETQTT